MAVGKTNDGESFPAKPATQIVNGLRSRSVRVAVRSYLASRSPCRCWVGLVSTPSHELGGAGAAARANLLVHDNGRSLLRHDEESVANSTLYCDGIDGRAARWRHLLEQSGRTRCWVGFGLRLPGEELRSSFGDDAAVVVGSGEPRHVCCQQLSAPPLFRADVIR